MQPRASRGLRFLLFAATLLASAWAVTERSDAVSQALIWLPTGVAVAGLMAFGWPALAVIAVITFVHRTALGYPAAITIPSAIGSTGEAALAAYVLGRFAPRADYARLSHILVLLVAALLAPAVSILASWAARSWLPDTGIPFYSGWGGWWRMNALGLAAVVPVVSSWAHAARRPGDRAIAMGFAVLTLAVVGAIMAWSRPGAPGVMLLTLVLPLTLFAALRVGPLGATTSAGAACLLMAHLATRGIGPFTAIAFEHRHVALQILLLSFLAVPLVFGALVAERDANELQRRAAAAQHDAVMRTIPDVTYRIRRDLRFLAVVAPPGAWLPLPAELIVGRQVKDVVEPRLAARIGEQVGRALAGQTTAALEYRLSAPEGRRDREMRFVPLPDGEVLAIVRDITARKLAERQLAWQAAVLERIATTTAAREVFPQLVGGIKPFVPPCMTSILLRRGNRLWVGHAAGVPPAFGRLCNGLQIGPQAATCGAAAHYGRTTISADIATDPLWTGLHDQARASGIHAAWSVPVRSPDGEVLGTLALLFPEPRRPRPEELTVVERAAMLAGIAIDRERRADLLASIQANITEGIFRWVPQHGVVHANEALARMFGYASPAELLQQIARRGNSRHDASLAQLLDVTTTGKVELTLCRRDDTVFHALISRSTVRDATGELLTCDGVVSDITALRDLEDRLRQSQKMEAVGQLAGGIAHDFNNLLTAIGGYAQSVRSELSPDSHAREDVDEILAATQRAATMTRQLLAFGRRTQMAPRVVDIADVVDEMLDMLQRIVGERHQLIANHARRGVTVRVDRGMLGQVLLNLVVNARDALPDGGPITIATDVVTAADGKPCAQLSVTDGGVGMTPDVQARAFEPFFTTKQPGHGTGLGLSMVHGIVHQSGGTIELDSMPGHGTTARIRLPHVAAVATPEPTVQMPRPAATAGTVLVVEDEPLVRDLVQRTLKRAGHTVLLARDGHAALAMVAERSGDVDAVVSDVVMPGMGGRELANQLHAQWPTIPVLLVSGYERDAAIDREPLPATAFLGKPFSIDQLLDTTARLLGQRRAGSPVNASPVSASPVSAPPAAS